MRFTSILLALGLAIARSVHGSPTVKLDAATFTGVSSGQLSKFLGIPFAYPPCVQVRRYSEVSNIDIGIAVRVISGFACLCLSDHTAKMTANL
jgi:hypothetical protein